MLAKRENSAIMNVVLYLFGDIVETMIGNLT